MRTTTILLFTSLAANIVLGGIWFQRHYLGSAVVATISAPATQRSPASDAITVQNHLWQHLEGGGTPRGLIDRLRAAGFPETIIRGIVGRVIEEEFERKRHRLTGDAELHPDPRKPWPNFWLDPKLGSQLRATVKEQRDTMRELFGDLDADTEEDKAQRQQRYGNLSDAKIRQLTKFWDDWGEKRMQVYSSRGGVSGLLPADIDKLNELNRSLREGLTGFLTPAEADEFLARNSQYAQQLQYMVGPLRLTEQEYRAALPLYQAYAEQYPNRPYLGNLDNLPSDQAAQKAAAETLVAQLKTSLPPDRAADVQLALDPSFSQLSRLVDRLELPLSAAKDVYAVQEATLVRAKAINADLALSADVRNAELTTLQQDATAAIGKALGGKRGLNAYKQFGGMWLTTLVPKPTR